MALQVTDKTQQSLDSNNISLNVIMEIDGLSEKFGAQHIEKELIFDQDNHTFDEEAIFFDAGVRDPNSRNYISLSGTTTNIKQQIEAEKAIESIRKFKVSLLDKNGELSKKFTPGVEVDEILSRRAKVFAAIKGTIHPNDSILLIDGLISSCSFTNKGTVELTIDHASSLKRQEIFIASNTILSGSINNSVTTIGLESTSGFKLPQDAVTTYVKIDDEIIRYTGINGNNLTGCTRAQFGTSAASHDNEAEVNSFLRLQGQSIELALKLMLSGGGYTLSETCIGIQKLDANNTVDNALWFENDNIEYNLGLVVGDHVQITGSASNNVTTTILDFGSTASGKSYIVVNANLSTEDDIECTVKFKSKYDTLSEGAGMLSTQVDVSKHQYWSDLFSSGLMNYDFYLEETINLSEFLAEQIYYPNGFYQVPGARASVQLTIPPLADLQTKLLSADNIKNPTSLKIDRTINKYFFNSVVYKYDRDANEDNKFNAGFVLVDADSSSRINTGNKSLKIESQGLRRSTANNLIINNQSKRFLDRYKFAAETITVSTMFKNMTIDVGDTVILQGLNITDTTSSGTREFGPRIFEVINKTFSLKTGNVTLKLLSTNYLLDGRFGVISPSSKVGSGATTTRIPLQQSYGQTSFEKNKWVQHFGSKLLVHDNDWNTQLECTLVGFDETANDTMVVSGLNSAPSQNMIVDICNYDNDETDERLYKAIYCHANKQVDVVSATSTSITIAANDVQFFNVGSRLELHPSDFSSITETKVTEINSNVLTVEAMGYTPSAGHKIDLIGFVDGGEPYRII